MKFDFLSESDQAYFIHKASTLVEALPFIREHSGDTIVIKYGVMQWEILNLLKVLQEILA